MGEATLFFSNDYLEESTNTNFLKKSLYLTYATSSYTKLPYVFWLYLNSLCTSNGLSFNTAVLYHFIH
jgi:hypothetical protein